MDNVTHSLFGHALGRVLGDRPDEPPAHTRAAIWASVLASNAPDFDFLIPRFAHDPKLAYLLHHRGHTHTVLWALPIGLALGALCARLAGVRERGARRRVWLIGALAGLLHVAFDALNNYGVHPFVPLDNHWYYGDAVFIVEPWLLAALIPQLALAGKSRFGRGLGFALGAGLLALAWIPSQVPVGVGVSTTLVLLLGFGLQRAARGRAGPSLWACAGVVLVFAGSSLQARGLLTEALARAWPEERRAALVLTPMPANPLCWSGLAVGTAAGQYRAQFARISLWPALLPPGRCVELRRGSTTARVEPATRVSPSAAVSFEREWSAPLASLHALRARACEVDAALRFMRAPYWDPASSPPIIGDLRYDSEPGLGFAELRARNDCRDGVPPWIPPLQRLVSD